MDDQQMDEAVRIRYESRTNEGEDPVLREAENVDGASQDQEDALARSQKDRAEMSLGHTPVDLVPADTGAALQKDIDTYAADLDKWKREDKPAD